MKKLKDNEVIDTIKKMPHLSFKNSFGELFTIHSDGVFTFMSGDEVDAMVSPDKKIANKYIPLFNPHFNIWSKDELLLLGQTLTEMFKND